MKTISADDVLGMDPCDEWDEERIRELLPEPVPILDVCDLRKFRSVSVDDRLWVLLRPEIMGERGALLFACDCAERSLVREREANREPDPRSWEVIAVARRYAAGDATSDELAAARDAAWAATRDAAQRWQLKRVAYYLRRNGRA